MVRVNLEFHKKCFVMRILRRDGLNWLNWKSKDLIGRLWEVEDQRAIKPKIRNIFINT